MIRLVALDLDRTTLNANGKLSEENRAAIVKAMQKGVHICIASGRAFDTLPKDVVSIPGIEYAITSNGAEVYRVTDGKCLRSYHLLPQSIEQILAVTEGYPVAFEGFIRGIAYAGKEYIQNPVAYGATEQAIPYIQSTRNPVDDMRTFLMEHKTELNSIDVVVGKEEWKKELIDKIGETTDQVYITSSIRQLIEIAYKDAGKQSGVRFLAEKLCIDRSEIAAFGDADNDRDMIEYAGHGVAVANACDTLKQVADHITLSHDENGVAYALEHILKVI